MNIDTELNHRLFKAKISDDCEVFIFYSLNLLILITFAENNRNRLHDKGYMILDMSANIANDPLRRKNL